jgi:hypothetical protein
MLLAYIANPGWMTGFWGKGVIILKNPSVQARFTF